MILAIGVAMAIVGLLSFLVVDNFGPTCVPERKLKIILTLTIVGFILMAIGLGFKV